jgi:hypothetical protein
VGALAIVCALSYPATRKEKNLMRTTIFTYPNFATATDITRPAFMCGADQAAVGGFATLAARSVHW